VPSSVYTDKMLSNTPESCILAGSIHTCLPQKDMQFDLSLLLVLHVIYCKIMLL